MPQTSDFSVEQGADDAEGRQLRADQQRHIVLFLMQLVRGVSLGAPDLRVVGVAPDVLPVHRSDALSAEHLIRGPPAPG